MKCLKTKWLLWNVLRWNEYYEMSYDETTTMKSSYDEMNTMKFFTMKHYSANKVYSTYRNSFWRIGVKSSVLGQILIIRQEFSTWKYLKSDITSEDLLHKDPKWASLNTFLKQKNSSYYDK